MSESTYYECCGSFGTHTHACNVALRKERKPASDPSSFAETPLAQLRAKIQAFKDGTQPAPPKAEGIGKHRRAAERREVETIHRTLNVVLAEIDALTDLEAAPPLKAGDYMTEYGYPASQLCGKCGVVRPCSIHDHQVAEGEAAASRPADHRCICANGEIEEFGTPDPLCRAKVHNHKPAVSPAVEGGREDELTWTAAKLSEYPDPALDDNTQWQAGYDAAIEAARRLVLAVRDGKLCPCCGFPEHRANKPGVSLAALHGRAAPQRKETKDV